MGIKDVVRGAGLAAETEDFKVGWACASQKEPYSARLHAAQLHGFRWFTMGGMGGGTNSDCGVIGTS